MEIKPTDKIVILVGPYIGDGKPETVDANIKEAEQYAIALANMGVPFFCPHLHTAQFERKARAAEIFYKKLDFIIMERIVKAGGKGALVAMPRWKSSGGTRDEVAWANKNNVLVFYPQNPGLAELNPILLWCQLDEGAKA